MIDEDLGRSGATADDRNGFRRLAEAVAHGRAGAIFTLEVSRLARSSQDWQRLLALFGVAQVVVCDEHAIYDPREADDKLHGPSGSTITCYFNYSNKGNQP